MNKSEKVWIPCSEHLPENDVLFETYDNFKKLKKNAERTHLIALYAYNKVKNNEEAWKHTRKYMEESDKRDD